MHYFIFPEIFTLADWVQPIKEAQLEPPVRDMVKAIGWGMIADDLPGNVDNLREVDVPVLSDDVAEAVYGGLDFETKVNCASLQNEIHIC